jgi:hypothetical protein
VQHFTPNKEGSGLFRRVSLYRDYLALGYRTMAAMVAVTMLAFPLHGWAQGGKPAITVSQAKKELQGLYDKVDAAAVRKDASGMAKFFDAYAQPGFTAVREGKKLTLAEVKKSIQESLPLMRDIQAHSTLLKVELRGKGEAVCTVKAFTSALVDNPQTRKADRFIENSTSQDVWVKTPQGWRVKSMKTLSLTITRNGKPFSAGN